MKRFIFSLGSLLFLCLLIKEIQPQNEIKNTEEVVEAATPKPEIDLQSMIGFVENKGQIKDQYGQTNRAVHYQYGNRDLKVQLRDSGFSYELVQLDSLEEDVKILTHRIDIQFVNAQQSEITATSPTPVSRNYYRDINSKKGITGVKTFRKVTYTALYPNIDLTFEIHENGQMEYHFIVHEGGDASQIQLEYQGQDGLALSDNKVQIQTRFGILEELIPSSWYEHEGKMEEVEVQYLALSDNTLAFYAPQGQGDLVIDPVPVLSWETKIPGTNADIVFGVSTDASGNVYATGWTQSYSSFATSGAHQSVHSGAASGYSNLLDAYLLKMNTSGSLVWATYYGGSPAIESDYGYAVLCDNNGYVYFGGRTRSSSGIATNGTYDNSIHGFSDAFLAKFDEDGVRQWGTYFGKGGHEEILDLAIDGNDDIYAVGNTTSSHSGMATLDAHQTVYGGGSTDGFIVKFDDTGNRIWSTFYGGSSDESVNGIYAKSNGDIYVAGNTNSSSGIATSGSHQSTNAGGDDAFLAKFNSSGVQQWGTYYGGPASDQFDKIELDGNSNIYMVGTTSSETGIATNGSFEPTYQGNQDAMLVKMNGSGVLQWGTYFGGSAADIGNSLAIFSDGNVVIGGSTRSSSGIYATCSPQNKISGSSDGFLTKFSSAGAMTWSTYYGSTITSTSSSNIEYIRDIVIDGNDDIICGASQGLPHYGRIIKYYEVSSNPEITVTGNGLSISAGDSSPRSADGTDFGTYNSCNSITQTFMIENNGSSCLGINELSLSDDTNFKITTEPAELQIDAGASISFEITFEPIEAGTQTVTVSIVNNDVNENPFTFSITGNSGSQEIEVSGNNIVINDGDNTPSAADGTDMGLIADCDPGSQTFTIKNTGTACLNISEITVSNSNYFYISGLNEEYLEVGASTTFYVRTRNRFVGTKTATVTITSTDADENPFTFGVQAEMGIGAFEITSNGIEINNHGTDDWGTLSFCETYTRTYTINNTGNGCLFLYDYNSPDQFANRGVTLLNGDAFFIDFPDVEELAAGESVDFDVTFTPTELGTASITAVASYTDISFHFFDFTIQATATNESVPVLNSCPGDISVESNISAPVSWTPPTAQEASCNNLQTGSINFINYGVNENGDDAFSIVFLGEVSEGTILYFTNRGWLASGGFAPAHNNEGTVQWEADVDYPAGTVVNFVSGPTFGSPNSFFPDIGEFNPTPGTMLLEAQDQLFIYAGSVPVTGFEANFLAAIDWSGGWDADATNAATSALPPAFANGINTISFGQSINYYDCIVTNGTSNGISLAILDPANWMTSASVVTASSCNFSSTAAYIPQIVLTSNYDPGDIFPIGTTTVTYSGVSLNGVSAINCSFDVIITDSESEIHVLGNGQEISNGATLTSTGDHTDFGNVSACSGTVERTFTIQNTASSDLNLTGSVPDLVTLSGTHFTVSTQPSPVITGGGNTTFTVRFDPAVPGTHAAVITIPNNDSDQDPFTFAIEGIGLADMEAPISLCQNIAIQLDDAGNATLAVPEIDAGSSDACSIVAKSVSPSSFDCNDIGPNTVTLTVTDAAGNSSSCTATVTVEDNTPPVAQCKNLTLTLDEAGQAPFQPADLDDGSSDNCGALSFAITNGPTDFGNCGSIGGNVVTLTVFDNSGNSSTCNANVHVTDNIPPLAQCKDITLFLDDTGNASITPPAGNIDNGSSDNCGLDATFPFSLSKYFFDCTDIGPNVITQTVTDVNGNTSTCTGTVTIIDAELPEAICQDITVQLDAAGNASITGSGIDGGSSDNCGIASLISDFVNFTCGSTGDQDVVLTVSDNSGNQSTCTATVTVEDVTVPTITCPDNITVDNDPDECGALVTGLASPIITDNCLISVNYSLDGNPLGIFSTYFENGAGTLEETFVLTGSAEITYTATDAGGNAASCSFILTVEDNQLATLDCPGNLTVDTDVGNCGAYVGWLNPAVSDNCPTSIFGNPLPMNYTLSGATTEGPTLVSSLDGTTSASASLSLGQTTVSYTFVDITGSNSSCSFEITVEENTAPEALCQDVTVQLDAAGIGSITASDVDNGSSDACGISSLELDKSDFTCSEVGSNTVNLTVTDVNGNVEVCTATINVEDNTRPTAVCQDLTVQLDDSGNASITPAVVDDNSFDNCTISSMTISDSNFSCIDVGNNDVTLTITDQAGLSHTCTSTVTIEDNQLPVAMCLTNINVFATSAAGAIVNYAAPLVTDNCSVNITQLEGLTSGATFPIGSTTNVLEIADSGNNTLTCTFLVTVTGVAPEIACPANLTVDSDLGQCNAVANFGATEAAGIPASTISYSHTPGTAFPVGITTVTATATNVVGSSFCTFDVIVEDREAPLALCKDLTVTLDEDGNTSIVATDLDNGSNDACGIENVSIDITDFDCLDLGDNTILLTVTDIHGNSAQCNANIEVIEVTPPDVWAELLFVSGTSNNASFEVDVAADDVCDPELNLLSVMEMPVLGAVNVSYKVKSKKKIKIDLKKNTVTVDGPDPQAFWNEVIDQGGVAVDNGQVINLTIGSKPNIYQFHFKNNGDLKEIIAPSFSLLATAADASGNAASATAIPVFPGNNLQSAVTDPFNNTYRENTVATFGELNEHPSSRNEVEKLRSFPNPFSIATTIEFSLSESKKAALKIFNIQGQLVNKLFDGQLDAGIHQRQWEGSDLSGVKLPSGIYLIQLQIGDEVLNEKIVLQD